MSIMSIDDCVRRNLDKYFRDCGTDDVTNLHDMVVKAAERPLLEVVMARCDGNQSRAAQMLGINRNTLRKKLAEHGLAG
jgi:Fis family transcriptional regulator